MGRTILLADSHFGHFNIIQYCQRPHDFESKILKNLLAVIKPEDIFIHLGDFCFGREDVMHQRYLAPINADKKILIRGNHDRKSETWYKNHGWDEFVKEYMIRIAEKDIILSHYPITPSRGDFNIHGHFHNHIENMEDRYKKGYDPKYHKLFSIELTDYQPIILEEYIPTLK